MQENHEQNGTQDTSNPTPEPNLGARFKNAVSWFSLVFRSPPQP
jgi:hypothetical protein